MIALRLSWAGGLPAGLDGSGRPPSAGKDGLEKSKGSLI